MKAISKTLTAAAVVLATLAVGAGPGHAGLLAKSADLNAGGFPMWVQDQTGLALQGCLDGTLGPLGADPPRCFLPNQVLPIEQAGFDPVAPKDENNWPGENMYYLSTTADMTLPTGQIANVEFAVEATVATAGAALVPGSQLMFHRLRMIFLPNTVAGAGTYTVVHPWGTTVFTPALQENPFGAGGARGRATADVNLALAADLPTPFAGILGNDPLFAMSTFPASVPVPPAINPPGFLGDCTSFLPITGGVAGVNNVQILGPDGTLVAETNLFSVCGQKTGMEVSPASSDFGNWMLNTPTTPITSTPITFTVTNLTGLDIPVRDEAAVPPVGLILTSSNPAFTIPPATDTCANGIPALATAEIPNTCTFEVVFSTNADGPQTGTISIASAGNPDSTVTVTGTGDGIPPVLNVVPISFTNTLTPLISGTVVHDVGVPIHDVTVSVNGQILGANHAAADGTWSAVLSGLLPDALNSITVTASDAALPAPGNQTIITVPITHDGILPVVSMTSPAAGLTQNTTPALTFTATDTNFSSNLVKVDGIAVTPTPATLPLLADGPHTVIVESLDSAGNLGTATTTFTVDATPPVITVASPKPFNGRLGVASPTLTFNVADANPNAANTVIRLDGIVVPNPVSGVTTLGPFTAGTAHTFNVSATDAAGNVSPITDIDFTIVFADGRVVSLGASPVSITDALAVLRHIVALAPLNPDQFAHADVFPLDAQGIPNPNGSVDIADALLILRRVVGLVATF